MAERKTPAAEGQTEEERAALAAQEADRVARERAVTEGAKTTEEARAQDAETNKAQEAATPYPSQEEADAMKSEAVRGAVAYQTRDAQAK